MTRSSANVPRHRPPVRSSSRAIVLACSPTCRAPALTPEPAATSMPAGWPNGLPAWNSVPKYRATTRKERGLPHWPTCPARRIVSIVSNSWVLMMVAPSARARSPVGTASTMRCDSPTTRVSRPPSRPGQRQPSAHRRGAAARPLSGTRRSARAAHPCRSGRHHFSSQRHIGIGSP